jgi:hypothetical protein
MHMSLNGREHMYISIGWLHVLRTLSFDVHGYLHCLGMSNAVSWELVGRMLLFSSKTSLHIGVSL